MVLKQGINIFLPVEQYKAVKDLGYRLDTPYVALVREGISLVLKKYNNKQIKKA